MDSTFQFPLLKLPIFPIDSVLLSFGLPDIINFSFISKRCLLTVQSLKSPTIGTIVIREKSVHMRVTGDSDPSLRSRWHFNHTDYGEKGNKMPIGFVIDGCEFRNFVEDNQLYSFGNHYECVNKGVKYLQKLFKRLMFHIFYYPDEIPRSRYPILIDCQKCLSMIIEGENQMEKEEELKELLGFHKATEEVYVKMKTSENFKSDIGLWGNPKNLGIYKDSWWLTKEMLFNSKSENLVMKFCRLTSEDCRSFVKRWFDSEDVNFKFLQLGWVLHEAPEDLNFENLGFELVPFDEKTRRHMFLYDECCALDFSTEMDFVRKDGLLASIMIYIGGGNDGAPRLLFDFCVWHERFPNLNGVNKFV